MKLQLKRSNVLEGGKAKEPTSAQMEFGELAVNYNKDDPALFLKTSNDDLIIRLAGKGSIGSGQMPSGDALPDSGNQPGDVFYNTLDNTLYYYNGTDWVPIASEENAADIYVGTFDEVAVDVPVDNRRNGFLLWETTEGNLFIWYDDGDSKQWVEASPGGGGGSASVAVQTNAPTNPLEGNLWFCTLDGRLYIYYDDSVTSQWVDASPNAIDENFYVNIDGDNMTGNLTLGGDKIVLNATDGSVTAAGNITAGTFNAVANNTTGVDCQSGGILSVQRASGSDTSDVFRGYLGDDIKFKVTADGSITAAGKLEIKTDTNPYIEVGYGTSGTANHRISWDSSIISIDADNGNTKTNSAINFSVDASIKQVIDETGNVLIGGTLPGAPNIELKADGSAEFASGSFDVAADGFTKITRAAGTGLGLYQPGDVTGNPRITLDTTGNASFTGNVTAGGTVEAASGFTQNGVPLSLDDITKTKAALVALKAEAAASTDHASLKAAIATALADI